MSSYRLAVLRQPAPLPPPLMPPTTRARAAIPPSRSTRPTRGRSASTRPSRSSSRRSSDYLPALSNVPTPKAVLGDVAGAPGILPVRRGRLPLHAHAGEGQPAREGLHHRQDRRRPRDDRGGGRRRKRLMATLDENRARLAQARRSAHASRWTTREADKLVAAVHADLLHHRHDPLARDRRAHRADGAGLPAGRRRQRLHPAHPRQRDHADHAGGRSGRPRPHGGHLPLAPGASRAELAAASSTGATTSRTTTIATRWA